MQRSGERHGVIVGDAISGRVSENKEAVAADGVLVDALANARATHSPSRRPPIQARTLSSIEDEIYKPACPTWRAACHPHPGGRPWYHLHAQ